MRNNEFSRKETKSQSHISKNYYIPNLKKSRFELLYENHLVVTKKLDLMRAKNFYNMHQKMIPTISKKAKEINRPKELFFKRLYTPNNNEKEINSKNKVNKKSKRNFKKKEESDHDDSFSSDEESLFMINDKQKNEKFRKLYRSPNMKKSVSFLFRPVINNKSKRIANKIKTKPKERLVSLSEKQKNNLKSILKQRELKEERRLKPQKEKELFKQNNNTYKPNIKIKKRKIFDKLYETGINFLKKKEEILKAANIQKEKEYLLYPFTPQINPNYSYTNLFKARQNTNNNKKNVIIYRNRNDKGNLVFSKTDDIYERNQRWKQLIEKKNEKLRNNLNNMVSESNTGFSPDCNNNIMTTDVSFIGKHIIEYETFLSRFNYGKYKKKLENVIYRKANIPPKKEYNKKLVVEYVTECDSNCLTNSGTIKQTLDKRPIQDIEKNRKNLKISDFFGANINLQSHAYFKESKEEENKNKDEKENDKEKEKEKDKEKDKVKEKEKEKEKENEKEKSVNNTIDININNKNLINQKMNFFVTNSNNSNNINNYYTRNDFGNLSYFNAVNNLVNKIN